MCDTDHQPDHDTGHDGCDHQGDHHRFDDVEAHERAMRRLAEVAGAECTERVTWDPDHHLQGHVDVGGTHLVVIAPRDDEHQTLVLSEREWDAVRRGCLTDA